MTGIEWTDRTWNPIAGCSVYAAGCTNCYAMLLAGTRLKHHPLYEGLTDDTKAGPVFNGKLRAAPDGHPVWTWPLRTLTRFEAQHGRRPRVFVGDMSDLFHKDRDPRIISKTFAVIARASHIDFQVLTKRSDVLLDYITGTAAADLARQLYNLNKLIESGGAQGRGLDQWPLPNVWLGVSVENQAAAEARIPNLLATPAALRFLSVEPLLESVDLQRLKVGEGKGAGPLAGYDVRLNLNSLAGAESIKLPAIDWVIAGHESGAKARAGQAQWVRDVMLQCKDAGTPFFAKQLCIHGRKMPMTVWPEDLKVRQFPPSPMQ